MRLVSGCHDAPPPRLPRSRSRRARPDVPLCGALIGYYGRPVAALFVEANGIYANRADVDVWPESRDARTYNGPHVVVAHPPCQRWGRYWSGGPSAKIRRVKGDDGGCFASALTSVRRWGGILEHPEASHAWRAFDIVAPPKSGGWIAAGLHHRGAWTCCVEQGHYGHPARKATWLYYAGDMAPPPLIWGPCKGKRRLDAGYHSKAERSASSAPPVRRLTTAENLATPPAFADRLLDIARGARLDSWRSEWRSS